MQLYNSVLLKQAVYLIPFEGYSASKISFSDLDLSGSPKVKYISIVGKPRGDFIMFFCWYKLSISSRFRDIPNLRFRLVTLTFQGHRMSNISALLGSQGATLYWLLLIQTLYLIPFARYSSSKISFSDLDLSGSPKVIYFTFFGKPRGDFVKVFCWNELSISYRLQKIPHLRFRIVTSTFQGHQRSNISTFVESSYATL